MQVMVFCALVMQGRFHAKDAIDFWGTKKKPEAKAEGVMDEAKAAEIFVNEPTVENAAAYLAWQRERFRRIQEAQAKLLEVFIKEQVGGIKATLVYYSTPDCPYCKSQDRILERVTKWLPLVNVRKGTDQVEAVPVIVVEVGEKRVRLDGVATELKIVQAMREANDK